MIFFKFFSVYDMCGKQTQSTQKIKVDMFAMLSLCSISIFNWLNEECLWTQYMFGVFYIIYTST